MPSVPKLRARRYTDRDDDRDIITLGYRRVSKAEMARDGQSLQRQLVELRDEIASKAAKRWIAGEQFHDVESGRKDDRPDYRRLLAAVRAHALAGERVMVLVVAFDRLGRNLDERVRAWKEITGLGAEIYAIRQGGIVTEFVYNIYASVAQEESRQIGERQWGINESFKAAGWHKPGSVAWGYRWRPATDEERGQGAPKIVLEPDEASDETVGTADAARQAFRLRADGASVRKVAEWAAALSPAERGGRTLNFAAVRKILRAPVYISRHGTTEPDDTHGPLLDRPCGRWLPLVEDDVFARCLMRDQEGLRMPRQASGEYILTGLLWCWKCGCRMSGRPRHAQKGAYTRTREYFCSSSLLGAKARDGAPCYATVRTEPIEAAVLEPLKELLALGADPRYHELARRATAREDRLRLADDPSVSREQFRRKLEQARVGRGRITAAWAAGDLDDEQRDEGIAALTEKIRETERKLADLGQPGQRREKLADLAVVLSSARGISVAIERAQPAGIREALGVLIERIEPVRVARGQYEAAILYTPLGRQLLGLRRSLAELEEDERFEQERRVVRGAADVVTGVDHSASVIWSTPDTVTTSAAASA